MASSRKTYDTDVITLRTVFAKNIVNSNIPALRVLTADGAGGTYWAIPSSLGENPAFNEIITSAGTYTADLSYNRFRLLAGEGVGMVDGPVGSNETTIFGKGFTSVDVSGENSIQSFKNNTLNPNIRLATSGLIQLRGDPATNTLFIDGPVSNPYIVSTGQYGFYQIKVTPEASTITSSVQGWSGDFITADSPSTLFRMIGNNDIKLSTNVTTNSIFFTISTFTSKGYLDISASAFSAYPSSLSTVSSLYVQNETFISSFISLSTNSVQWSSVQSSIDALAVSTGSNYFILTGLINARATIIQLNTEISNVNNNIRSSVQGLGSSGYISSLSLTSSLISTTNFLSQSFSSFSTALGPGGGGSGDVTTENLLSTVEGLGTAGYISSLSLTSSLISTTNFVSQSFSSFSTALGPGGGGSGDVTTENLLSTVEGLGSANYISSLSLTSSFISTTNFVSQSFSSFSTAFGGVTVDIPFLSSFTLSTGFIEASTIITSTLLNYGTLSTHSLVVYGESTLTVQGLSFFQNTLSSYSIVSDRVGILDSTTGNPLFIEANEGSLEFGGSALTAQPVLNSTVSGIDSIQTSTIVGLGTFGYLSSLSGFQASTGFLQTSTVVFLDVDTNDKNTLYVSGQTLLLNGNFITGGAGGGGGGGVTKILAGTNISISPLGGIGDVTINNTGPTAANIVSTVQGLGSSGYISSLSLTSSLISTTNFISFSFSSFSTAVGPGGGSGDITTSNLTSTVQGLGSIGYISSLSLTSSLISTTNFVSQSFSSFSTALGPGGGGAGGEVIDEQIASTLQYSPYFSTIKIGLNAGLTNQAQNAIAIGENAGNDTQSLSGVAIGLNAAQTNQGDYSIAIGQSSGNNTQAQFAVAIGLEAGLTSQGSGSIAIGNAAGFDTQGESAVAIGLYSGNVNQGQYSIAIGREAGNGDQGPNSVAIGLNAGNANQAANSVAIGLNAGNGKQGINGIAIGENSGFDTQGTNSVAIGLNAGNGNQGVNSIAIGTNAGFSMQAPSSIVISALGDALDAPNEGFFVGPLRTIFGSNDYSLGYNSLTKEVGMISNAEVTTEELISTATRWATYPAVSTIIFSNDANNTANQIVSPGNTNLQLITGNLVTVTGVPNDDGIAGTRGINVNSVILTNQFDVNNDIQNVNYFYVLVAGEDFTGSLSTPVIINDTGTSPLFLSSLFLGGGGGVGELATDDTVTNLFWNGTQLNGGGGGGGGDPIPFLSSFSLSTGTIFASSITSFEVSTINIYAATLNMSVLFI